MGMSIETIKAESFIDGLRFAIDSLEQSTAELSA